MKERDIIRLIKKVCDFMAAVCLVFDVDWDKEFEDDEYVIACKGE